MYDNDVNNQANYMTTGCTIATSGYGGTMLGTGTNYTPNTTTINGNLVLNNNSTSMNQQVKVAVFQVTRNKHNEIKSSEFITEMWIEKKPGISIDFAVARELGDEWNADEIVIKEIYHVII
jgi:hypothetical protein